MPDNGNDEILVRDRRRFNEDGSARKVSEEGEWERKSAERQPEAQPQQEQAKPQPSRAAAGKPSPAEAELDVDFSSFIVGLATQVLVMLGEIPHPETGLTVKQLDAAKQTIDILALLEIKTQGNLTGDEQQLLGEILASVRMAYVRSKNQPAAK